MGNNTAEEQTIGLTDRYTGTVLRKTLEIHRKASEGTRLVKK